MTFSQRHGYRPVREAIQKDGIDDPLRNSLWNVLDRMVWGPWRATAILSVPPEFERFSRALWSDHYQLPVDTRPTGMFGMELPTTIEWIRDYFMKSQWYEVYDFIEWIVNYFENKNIADSLNASLEQEMSAYRFVDGILSEIVGEQEIAALEEALSDQDFPGVRSHLRTALEHMSNRENPDYRNSIKESISAVESMANEVSGLDKASLGDALNALERERKLHPALKQGFSKLYGYTSDADGIRHAMLSESNVDAADAKYFLVSCTAFTNYLKNKIPSSADGT